MKLNILWLDDVRDPNDSHWVDWLDKRVEIREREVTWVKDYENFTKEILENGLPNLICFDHDLGKLAEEKHRKLGKKKAREVKRDELSGYDCAKWLVNYCLDNNITYISYLIQSANTVGKENINSLLSNFNIQNIKSLDVLR